MRAKILSLISVTLAGVSSRTTVHFDAFTDLKHNASAEPLKLTFGSCFHIFNMKNDIFRTIGNSQPHLWAWLGDAAYTDNVHKAGCKSLIICH